MKTSEGDSESIILLRLPPAVVRVTIPLDSGFINFGINFGARMKVRALGWRTDDLKEQPTCWHIHGAVGQQFLNRRAGSGVSPSMTRFALFTLPLLLTGCYSGVGSLHDIHVDEKKGEWAWCLAPSGVAVAWASTGRDAMGRTYGTCNSPNRFVHVRACAPGQVDAGESPEALAARVRLSDDNSLIGDTFEGRPFCAPHPPS